MTVKSVLLAGPLLLCVSVSVFSSSSLYSFSSFMVLLVASGRLGGWSLALISRIERVSGGVSGNAVDGLTSCDASATHRAIDQTLYRGLEVSYGAPASLTEITVLRCSTIPDDTGKSHARATFPRQTRKFRILRGRSRRWPGAAFLSPIQRCVWPVRAMVNPLTHKVAKMVTQNNGVRRHTGLTHGF